ERRAGADASLPGEHDCHVPPIRTHPRPTYPDPPYSARFQTFYPLWGTSNPTNLDPPYSMESILVKG
ncbi:MAG TPA: hypothetical protein VMG63_26875, partial [Terriglobia bacterium]|nr:hypothetical protein [Terriglobia bacterium]